MKARLMSSLMAATLLLSSCASPYMAQIMAMPDGPAKVAALQAAEADQNRRRAEVGAAVTAGLAGLAAGAAAAAAAQPRVIVAPVYQPYYPAPFYPVHYWPYY